MIILLHVGIGFRLAVSIHIAKFRFHSGGGVVFDAHGNPNSNSDVHAYVVEHGMVGLGLELVEGVLGSVGSSHVGRSVHSVLGLSLSLSLLMGLVNLMGGVDVE